MAVLLAAAAVLAALLTARATVLGTEATGLWQRSVGEEQKRGALLLEDARFTYGPVADMAFTIATEQLQADELSAAATEASPEAASRIAHEAQVHERVAEAFRTSVIGTDAEYVLPSGGYDLQRSLADDRLGHGADLRLDPQATAAAGDHASDHATRLLSTTVGVGVEAAAARLTSEATTRLNASSAPEDLRLGKALEASEVAIGGTSRQMIALEAGDAPGQAIGAAEWRAGERLSAVAEEMGATPDASSPLDAYARVALASSLEEISAMVDEQNRQRDLADVAGARSTDAVLGLSLAALAGVLVGLAAVIGQGRSGEALLALAYVLAAASIVMAAGAAGYLPDLW